MQCSLSGKWFQETSFGAWESETGKRRHTRVDNYWNTVLLEISESCVESIVELEPRVKRSEEAAMNINQSLGKRCCWVLVLRHFHATACGKEDSFCWRKPQAKRETLPWMTMVRQRKHSRASAAISIHNRVLRFGGFFILFFEGF